jgi:hypothetical protein
MGPGKYRLVKVVRASVVDFSRVQTLLARGKQRDHDHKMNNVHSAGQLCNVDMSSYWMNCRRSASHRTSFLISPPTLNYPESLMGMFQPLLSLELI